MLGEWVVTYLPPHLQKPNHFQRLLDIGDLVTEADGAPLRVDFHELIFGDHLLEAAECGFDIFAGGDVVGDVVDEGGDGDSAGVGLGCYCAVSSLVLFVSGIDDEDNMGESMQEGQ